MATVSVPRKARTGRLSALPPPLPMHRFSVAEYHRMIEAGILHSGERAELLEGWIVAKMTQNPPHAMALSRLQRGLTRQLPDAYALRSQSPITIRDSEPEPDITVAQGPEDRYDTRHPGPADVYLVIEISDTTLPADQGIKLQLYARSRIPVYWIVNLIDRRVEVYSVPRGGRIPAYRKRQDYGVGDSLPLIIAGKDLGSISVRQLLPRTAIE